MKTILSFPLFLVLVATGCTPAPQPIHYGQDACAHCKMGIVDQRFGAELLTKKGKTYKFDSIECLAAFMQEEGVRAATVQQVLVTNFEQPGRFIPAGEAFYVQSPNVRSPMGMNLSAFGPGTSRAAAVDALGGRVYGWEEVLATVKRAQAGADAHPTPTPAE